VYFFTFNVAFCASIYSFDVKQNKDVSLIQGENRRHSLRDAAGVRQATQQWQ